MVTMLQAKARPLATILETRRGADALVLRTGIGQLKVEPFAPNILRIALTQAETFRDPAWFGFSPAKKPVDWTVEEGADSLVVNTGTIALAIDRRTGSFTFRDAKGQVLLR